jgi:site-specific DNA recombinase
MTRAAIYARRSTDEHQEASLDVQLEEARLSCDSKGWSVDERHVFLEDAVSRAEFVNRPALNAMKLAAFAKAFDVIVVRDETRLGGDMIRTMMLLQELTDLQVRVYYYYADEELQLHSPMQKLMAAFGSCMSEQERLKISERTHEHLKTKARSGRVAGGVVYGYDNVREHDGVVRVINDEQANVVREIFAMTAAGVGLRGVAGALNRRGVAPPSAGRRGTKSWSPNCLREILRRELYVGVQVWNKAKKTYRGGTKVRVARPASEWIRSELPHLRIIDELTWASVTERNASSVRVSKRRGAPAAYLLTGLARCSECGGPLQATNRRSGGQTIKAYVCAWHRNRGDSVCGNALGRPVDSMDNAVLESVAGTLLNDEIIEKVIDGVTSKLRRSDDDHGKELKGLGKDVCRLEREVSNLTNALAQSSSSAALLAALSKHEAQLEATRTQLAKVKAARPIDELQIRRIRSAARTRLADLRATMARNPRDARKVLEAVLSGPITCTPQRDPARYKMKAPLGLPEGLFGGSDEVHYRGVPSGV